MLSFVLLSFQINIQFLFFIFNPQALHQIHHYLKIIIFHLNRFHLNHLHFNQIFPRLFVHYFLLIYLWFLPLPPWYHRRFIHCLFSQLLSNSHKMFKYPSVVLSRYQQQKALATSWVYKLVQILYHLARCSQYTRPLLLIIASLKFSLIPLFE